MPPKRKGSARAALHRVEDGLRRLFRSRPATKPNVKPPRICLHHTDWDGLERFSGILSMDVEGFGQLTSAISRFSNCVKAFENQARAHEEYSKIGMDLNDLFYALARHFDETDGLPTSGDSIQKLARAINEETQSLESDEDCGPNGDGVTIKNLDRLLKGYRKIRTMLALFAINENMKIWKADDDEALNRRLEHLSHSSEAHYRAFGLKGVYRTGCIPNTRTNVLQDLREWIHYGKFQKVYWLNGLAGTGKTTVAYSLCEYLENAGKPAASFFCSRNLPDCGDVKRIFPSVAYQLARLSRPFRCAVSSALEQDLELCNRPIDEQFKRLIVIPLKTVGHTFGVDVVVVIDALEECEDKYGVNQILDACFDDSSGLPIRFLITSRQNPEILERMLASQGVLGRAELHLHEVDRTVVQGDIRTYLKAQLKCLDLSDADIECLVQRCGGWFLYAAAIPNYAGEDNPLTEGALLKRLLEISSYTESTADCDLDVLYAMILEEVVDEGDLEDARQADVMLVLRTILCTQELVTMDTIAGILGLDFSRLAHTVLRPLLPVVHVPNTGVPGIALYHSFASYLVDPQRSDKFYCDSRKDNALLAQSCFSVVDGASPPFNVCNLKSSYLLDQEVTGIGEIVEESISQALWYACQHWATHLKLAGHSDDLLTLLHNFLSRRLLLWMEVMNVKRHISEGAELLHDVYVWLQEVECPASTRDLALDAWKFVEAFSSSAASKSTPHIYLSALRFWPVQRPVAIHYIPMLRCGVRIIRARLESYGEDSKIVGDPATGRVHSSQTFDNISRGVHNNSHLLDLGYRQPVDQSLEHHTRSVQSVTYSPDGACIASCSYDKTIRIWDAHTGRPVGQPLTGHIHGVNSVAYSHDGAYIASGSSDGSVRIWDARNSQPVGQPLRGHTCRVNSVAYSPDGAYIVSGSSDETIRIWDVRTGQPAGQPLKGHTHRVWSVSYSPNGAYIASGSQDETIRIWDAFTGQPVGQPLNGHTSRFNSVSYSPDGAYIVSGSDDKTIRIWDAHTGQPVGQPFSGHTGAIWSVSYSPNGAYIASGSTDKTIRIWDAHTGQPVGRPLEGHMDGVWSIAYSPNGACIASASWDGTTRVWDSRVGYGVHPSDNPLQPIRSGSHLPNRSLIPSAFAQYITRIA
ncbi:hypothetical protein FS749_001724 [Ceratobasidium sp. UAMH 11750]|nr:hypothetical protein FS749_001724 [Ceratobasidium sp. UAMH 11750]